jgi:hypothetical protein
MAKAVNSFFVNCVWCEKVNHRNHHHMESTYIPVPKSLMGGWCLDYVVIPPVKIAFLVSRVSTHVLMRVLSWHACAVDVWRFLEDRLLDDPLMGDGLEWVYMDEDPLHTRKLESMLLNRRVKVLWSIPNSHGNGVADKYADVIRRAVTKRSLQVGSWDVLVPELSDFLQRLESEFHTTPKKDLQWHTPDDTLRLDEDKVRLLLEVRKGEKEDTLAEHRGVDPLPPHGVFWYWSTHSEQKHPDAHCYRGPFVGTPCTRHNQNCRVLQVGNRQQHAAVHRLKLAHRQEIALINAVQTSEDALGPARPPKAQQPIDKVSGAPNTTQSGAPADTILPHVGGTPPVESAWHVDEPLRWLLRSIAEISTLAGDVASIELAPPEP